MLSSYIDNDYDNNENPAKDARIISNRNHKNTKLCVSVKPILCFFLMTRNCVYLYLAYFPQKICTVSGHFT